MTIGKRIRSVRQERGLSQQDLGKKIGIKASAVSMIESEKRNVSDQVILAICREYGINEEWLRTGVGEMETPKPTDTMDALAKERGMSENDRILVEKFLGLKPEGREAVMQYILEVAAAVNAKNAGASPPAAQPAAVDEKKGLSVQPVTEEEKAMAELAISGLRYEKEPALQVSSAKESGAG